MLVSVDVQAQDALFDWRVGDPNWQSPAKESDRLITDRPHVSEATATVGKGRIQLETGYTFFLDRNAGIETTRHSWPEPLLRWGLFADWFELRLGTNYLQETQSTLLRRSRLSGMDDMLIASKIALVKQRGLLPDFTIFPQLRIPTGDRDWTGDKTLPGVNFAYSWAVTPLIEIECNTVFNRKRADDGVNIYTEQLQTINVEYDLSERWLGFTEFLFYQPWANDPIVAPTNYFHTGLQYFITPDLQFDIHSAVGLNRAAENLAFTGCGLCVRW
ncbi:transporter [Pirellulaceae bacterium SH501]